MRRSRATATRGPVAFGPFTLDFTRRRLLRWTTVVPLRPKAWEVLCHLALRPGVVVSSDALLDAVWPDATVTPQTLTNVIRELRIALGDDARAPRFIGTVHGQGHVFLGVPAADRPATTGPRERGEPMVARTAEMAHLHGCFEEALGGASRVVLVAGEPGIGKTTLVDAFRREVATLGGTRRPRTLTGLAIERHGGDEAYLPLLAALETLAASAGGRGVRTRLRRIAPTWLAASRLPGEAERATLERTLAGTTSARMLREGVALLRALAEERPLLVILEDLHWSDLATLDLVAAIARDPVPAPLVIVATYRPADAVERAHPLVGVGRDLVRRGHVTPIALAPFDHAAVRAYLDARFASDALASDALVDRLEARSAGNPLFLRTLVDTLVASGVVTGGADGWTLASATDLAAVPLPASLQAVVYDALDDLAPETRAVVEAASVAGLEFVAPEVAGALGRPALAIEEICETLARSGRLLRGGGAATWPDGVPVRRYAFVHMAHQGIVYDAVAPLRRRALHCALADVLEAAYRADLDAVAPRLAAHCEAGGLPARAVLHLDRAALHAERRFAYRESIAYLQAALRQVDAAAAAGTAAPDVAGTLHLRLANLQALVLGYSAPEIAAHCRAALASFAGRHAPVGVFLAEAGLTRYAGTHARYHEAREHGARLLALAGDGLPDFAGAARLWASYAAAGLADLRGARTMLEEALAAPPAPGVLRHHDVHRMARSQLSIVLTIMGEAEAARAHAIAALAHSEEGGRPADLAHAYVGAVEHAVFADDPAKGRPWVARAMALAAENGFRSFLALCRIYAGAFADDVDAAHLTDMRAAIAERRRLGDRWLESHLLGLVARAELAIGNAAAADATLDEAFAHVEATGERYYEAELHRLRGVAALASGSKRHRAAAASAFERACTVARAQAAGLWEARAHASRSALGP